ncbi:hypothetical protein CCAL13119_08940 [Campylobacter sp. RM13119]|uniref:hypothetical protein n=1 Tax=Campylobacter TaxID=194 RepID=UPI001472B336|nr:MULTISPECIES: hypothetical protein [unclassified Campylobacter]MBE3607048.1 hypothetical protein [Campylobacter sp. RM13119]
MNLKETYQNVLSAVPEALPISKASPQGGVYIIFESLKNLEWKKDRAAFRIVFASRSLTDDNFAALEKIDEIRARFIKNAHLFADDVVANLSFDGFEDSLYKYSLLIEVNIYRDEENEFLAEA